MTREERRYRRTMRWAIAQILFAVGMGILCWVELLNALEKAAW